MHMKSWPKCLLFYVLKNRAEHSFVFKEDLDRDRSKGLHIWCQCTTTILLFLFQFFYNFFNNLLKYLHLLIYQLKKPIKIDRIQCSNNINCTNSINYDHFHNQLLALNVRPLIRYSAKAVNQNDIIRTYQLKVQTYRVSCFLYVDISQQ